jgi:hypothetical protein
MDWVDLVRRWVPRPARFALQRFVPASSLKLRYFARRNPLASVISSDVSRLDEAIRVGIFRNRAQFHTDYVAACQEIGVPFRVIDLYAEDWLQRTRDAGCDLFLAWPDATATPAAKVIKDRLDLLECHEGLNIVPCAAERWMYEDKIRLADWLACHGIPHPRTWVFFDRAEAEAFAADCELPIVTKTAFGAASTGVRILRTRRQVRSTVSRAFGRGVLANGADLRDRQWGSVLFQAYVDLEHEWRLVRIGDAYFGHPKGRRGDFHSGSGRVAWNMPEERHLDLLHAVTEAGGFRSMAVDVFEGTSGGLLVNELQTVFGAGTSVDQMRQANQPGRMVRRDGGWRFEAGDFARNACANARVLDALERRPS